MNVGIEVGQRFGRAGARDREVIEDGGEDGICVYGNRGSESGAFVRVGADD